MVALGKSELSEVAEPTAVRGEVIIEPEAAGICGTDLHVLHEGVYLDLEKDLPVTMGHEVLGRVVELGPTPQAGWVSAYGGPEIAVGDRVVAEPLLNCGSCPQCLRGHPNLCRSWSHLGFLRNGVWAERVAVPAARLTRIAESVPAHHAVLAEPLACALHFLDRAAVRPGDSLTIVGGGPAGQMTLLAARAAGVGPIVVSDPIESRRELAVRHGAEFVVDPSSSDLVAVAREHTHGEGPDVVIEIAGTPPAVTDAVHLPRKGGTLVLAGICGAPSIPVDTNRVVVDEIDVRGAHATRWQMGAAVSLLEAGLAVGGIVSKTRPWEEAAAGMQDLATQPDLCKVVLTF
jgi:2-desacetyl-2-hydroxyethyl bacteriochlorophyllide A dehydrogenase